MMKLLFIACSLTFLTASCVRSTFTYSGPMCSYVGKYNPKKISETKLQNTLDKLIFPTYIETNSTAWELDDVEELDVEALKEECNTELRDLQILEMDYPFTSQHFLKDNQGFSTILLSAIKVIGFR